MKQIALAFVFLIGLTSSVFAQTVEDRITALEGSDNSLQSRVTDLEAMPVVDLAPLLAAIAALQAEVATLQEVDSVIIPDFTVIEVIETIPLYGVVIDPPLPVDGSIRFAFLRADDSLGIRIVTPMGHYVDSLFLYFDGRPANSDGIQNIRISPPGHGFDFAPLPLGWIVLVP